MQIRVDDVLHPTDRAAIAGLRKLAPLNVLMKQIMRVWDERKERAWYLSNAVRLSPTQLGEYYRLLPPICESFGMPIPELYLTQGAPNAMTVGHTQPFIVLYTGLLEVVEDEQELRAVLAHECGHILCGHALYRSVATLVAGVGEDGSGSAISRIPLGPGIQSALQLGANLAVSAALTNWYQKSELSADRAAAGFLGRPEPMLQALFHMCGVPKWIMGATLSEFVAQADEFEAIRTTSKWDRFVMWNTRQESAHPMPVLRLKELAEWATSPEFELLVTRGKQLAGTLGPSCRQCGRRLQREWRFCQHCGSQVERPVLTVGPEPLPPGTAGDVEGVR